MIKKFAFVFLLFVLMIALTGCTLPLPTCSTDSLQEVTLTSPAQVSVVDTLNPTLEWSYPSTECAPAGYAITMWEGPVMTTNIGGGTGNPSTSWGPGSPLQPGKQYRWNVAPINGTTLGPVSDTFIFFTGPVCSDTMLAAPTLVEPADGAIFNESTDLLWWDYTAGCTPEGYQVDVSTDPTFATNLGDAADIPLTRMMLAGPLTDCQTYYWRVAAKNDPVVGPFSPTRTFVRDLTGSCGGPGGSPPASASIGGIVWHDLCITPAGPAPDPLSAGCVDAGSGVIRANGIREPGEPGIAGVQVDLHFGGCATPSVASVITDSNGQYLFDGILAFGSYCVAIRPLNPPNDSILIPGEWTYPPSVSGADAFANAMVDTGTVLANVDFGWDYQFLPVAGEPTIVPSAVPSAVSSASDKPQFEFTKNAFCRKGPGLSFSDLTAIPAGDIVEVRGVSADTQWYFVFWSKFKAECWVAISTGKLIGDAFSIPVLASPPTPVPSVVPSAVPSNNNNNPPTPVPTMTPVKP